MTIREAITLATALTGQVVADALLVRWLSEFDGKLAVSFFREDEWTPYNPTTDMDKELLVPYPYDGTYTNHLEAMTYFTNGEYDRYENARTMSEKVLADYRAFMQRTQARQCRPGFPIDRGE